mgnify:CR=1 FL=1
MGTQTSPYGAGPDSLDSQNPNDDMAKAAAAFMAGVKPTAQMAAPAGEDPMAAAARQFMSGQTEFAPAQPNPQQPFALDPNSPEGQAVANNMGADENQDPGFIQNNLNTASQFKDRLIAGIAGNDQERVSYFRNKYGDKNVKISGDGSIMLRKSPGAKFDRLDPKTLNIVNDIFTDNARNLLIEGAMLPAEVAGGAAGFMAGGLGGSVLGMRAGRIGAAGIASKVADRVAEFAGVPQDPNRSPNLEAATNMALEAAVPVVGKALAKYIPGTYAYRSAKASGEKEIVALSKQSMEVAEAANRLSAKGDFVPLNGEQIGVPGANVLLMGHQLNPDNPDLTQLAKQSSQLGKFINAERGQAEGWAQSLENNLMEIARRGNAGPIAPDKLASTVTNAVDGIERAEGQAIGKYLQKATAKLGDKPFPLPPETNGQIKDMMQKFGFKLSAAGGDVKIVPPSNQELMALRGQFGLTKMGEIKSFVNALQLVGNSEMNGGASIKEIRRLVSVVGDLNPTASRSAMAAPWGQLTAGLRQQQRKVIAAGLDDTFEAGAFNATMNEYASIRQNMGTLKNVLRDDASAKAIVGNLFTGKESLPRIRAIKSLTASDPAVMDALKEEFINQQLLKHADRSSALRYNAKGMLDSLNKQYGPEFMHEVLGPEGSQTIKDLLLVGERLQNTFQGSRVDELSQQAKQGGMNTVIGLFANIKFKAINGMTALVTAGAKSREAPLFEIMTRDGIDKYVAAYPGRIDKPSVAKNLKDALAQYKVMRALGNQYDKATKMDARHPQDLVKGKLRNYTSTGRAPSNPEPQPVEEEQ